MKYISFLFLLFSMFFHAQKMQVLDAETGKTIRGARVMVQNQVLYTNDDGFVPVDHTEQSFEIYAVGFKKVRFNTFRPIVKLNPRYKDIQEVKITKVNIKKIFEDVLKNYKKRYYSKPSLYDVTIKQKNFDNNQFHLMVISEAKMWSKTNTYNTNLNDEIQLQLNNVKYLNTNTSDNIFFSQNQ